MHFLLNAGSAGCPEAEQRVSAASRPLGDAISFQHAPLSKLAPDSTLAGLEPALQGFDKRQCLLNAGLAGGPEGEQRVSAASRPLGDAISFQHAPLSKLAPDSTLAGLEPALQALDEGLVPQQARHPSA